MIIDSEAAPDRVPPARLAGAILTSAACLALLFTAQDGFRRGASGQPVVWSRVFALNALDWVVWATLVPFIIFAGERLRLDAARRRVAGGRVMAVIGWLALAVAFCVAQSTISGIVIRYASVGFFGAVGPISAGGVRPPLGRYLMNWGLGTSSLNLMIFVMTAGALHAALYYRDLRERQLAESALQARLASAELNVLRMQVQPHFLFNALHTVSSLMVSDIAVAQSVVAALGDLLRASLDHMASQEIPLRDELAFVGRYLDIQRARFRSRLAVAVDVDDAVMDALVPTLILQPLVENAIRHGIEAHSGSERILIRAARRGDSLAITVSDDGSNSRVGERTVDDSARNGGAKRGIGLTNTEARLTTSYGASHSFRAAWNGDGHFDVTFTLPYHVDAASVPAR